MGDDDQRIFAQIFGVGHTGIDRVITRENELSVRALDRLGEAGRTQ